MTADAIAVPQDPASAPWSAAELASTRARLEADIDRLLREIQMFEDAATAVVTRATLEILHDELDVASQRADLAQDAVQVENTRAILAQTEHVIARLDAGLYGVCEVCSGPIGRPRLEAFPRATLCMGCVR